MSDNLIRHLTALIATLICVLCFATGYYAGPKGWWWVAIVTLAMYFIVYKIIDK